MPMERIIKLIDECASWPHLDTFLPFLTNEPFADMRMAEIIALANRKLPRTNVVIFTNAGLLSQRVIENLKSNECRINHLFFSLHHSRKDEYEAELGIPFEKTIENIHRAIDANLSPHFTLLKVNAYKEQENRRFKDFIDKEFPGIDWVLPNRFNWKGDIDPLRDIEQTLDMICPRTHGFCVTADGRQARCCLDQDAAYGFGDCNQYTMLEIYNSEGYRRLREVKKRDAGDPCNRCNMA